ncbi:MAG: DUF3078 domain-containing protein [Prevotellaceae bacterium]|nr:DUF3078 domain-containing protein [Prevotellaceae bacterium]
MKKFILIAFAMLLAGVAAAQEIPDTTYWKEKGVAGINLAQTSLSYWAAGGERSFAADAMFNFNLDYKRDRNFWQNRLELAYGINNSETKGRRKTSDKIYLNSIYGYRIVKHWYLAAFVNFQTQFSKGSDYTIKEKNYISKFMAPGYLSAGPGIAWIPQIWFSVTLSPVTWRGTFVLDENLSAGGAYGVKPGKRLLSECGAGLRIEFQRDIMTNMNLYSRMEFFSDYSHKPQNVDMYWDIQLNMKINRLFAANLSINLAYDDDVKFIMEDGREKTHLQFKETLGVGLQYNF